MNELEKVSEFLKAAQRIAEDGKMAEILIYLISMAVAEAEYQMKARKGATER